ncbi:tRNA selenocysteine 1-associated protein 1-like [Chrysoperla carnea]|uniref:tRNA selenocysteine 1-associated protein 1-like n=1 Tax=Chrysoperla carnea TaxID=189513 RepID=UPI001D08918F|nr:tRNA selenocysteine 1-associated protein 1-like [Chrysoperla carnea]
MMTGMIHCQLWMGNLEPFMTESFIMLAFQKMGEHPQNVKIMRNKFTGEPAGYCFVHFSSDEQAIHAMHKLNGKPIPDTNPIIRFRLNNASNTDRSLFEREFSVWIGDLSPDVDDYSLYRTFASRYNTIKSAKVILDNSGFSKGYGFVRFGCEDEQKNSLTTMNGYIGLGSKPLKICNAVPKPKGATTILSPPQSTITLSPAPVNSATQAQTYTTQSQDYLQYYDPSAYWQNYAWRGYYDQTPDFFQSTTESVLIDTSALSGASSYNGHGIHNSHGSLPESTQAKIDDDLELIEYSTSLDVDKLNKELNEQDQVLWDAVENSKWLPCEDLPEFC